MKIYTFISCVVFWSLLFTKAYGQSNSKAKETLNKGNYSKAIQLYTKALNRSSSSDSYYPSLLYNLAEAYRYSGNYFLADSIHSKIDFSKVSYWGYALTLLQQFQSEKCLSFAKYHLKFDPLHAELTAIKEACELAEKRVDESKIEIKAIQIPKRKERIIVPGFILGEQSAKEAIQQFENYSDRVKQKDSLKSDSPISISTVYYKKKKIENYTLISENKIAFSIDPGVFTYIYNPGYYKKYKLSTQSYFVFNPQQELTDSLKKLTTLKEDKVMGNEELIKEAWLSSDKKMIVFSSNKLKGEGGYDLFLVRYTENGWGKPINFGARVNSTYNEITPFISPNGILYYSSNGRIGHGGYDVYSFDLKNLLEDVQAENLAKPFNSAFDDYGFLFHEHTGFGLFASTRPYGITSNQLFVFENKIINCPSIQQFNDYAEIKTKNSRPEYPFYFNQLALQDSLPKGKIFYWLMGDGNKERGLKFKHTYKSPGIYNAILMVYNPTNRSYDTTKVKKTVVVEEKDFLYLEYETKGRKVEFTTSSSQCKRCEESNFYWDFGDGNYGCGFTVTHEYETYGNYTVRLIMKYTKDRSDRSMSCFERIKVEE